MLPLEHDGGDAARNSISSQLRRIKLKTTWKATTMLLILGALAATPLFAHVIPYALTFTTSFPFYVGNQYMPAGSYTVTETGLAGPLFVRDADWKHTTFIQYTPAETSTPVNKGMATFREYGNVAFLHSLTVTGQASGLDLPDGRREKAIASRAGQERASLNTVPLEPSRSGN
jgi:hypothetical protein